MRSNAVRWTLCLLLVGTLGAAGSAFADGKLRGSAKDADGNPLPGVTIKLIPSEEKNPDLPAIQIEANKKGEFLFGVIRPGVYHIAAFKEGMRISYLKAQVWVPDNPKVWSYDGEVRPGAEMPAFMITGLTDGTVDFVLADSLTGPGPWGTGEKISSTDAIIQAIQEGRTEEALREIDSALAQKPEATTYRYLRAFALLNSDRAEEASAAIDQVLEADPEFEGARLLKGKILEADGKEEEAIPLFRDEAESAPSDQVKRDAYLALGVALEKVGRSEEAAEALEKLVEVAPDLVDVYRELHTLYLRSGQTEKAEAAMKKLEEAGGEEDPALLYNMGAERFNAGDYETAAGFFKRVIERDPKMADAYFRMGQVSVYQGKSSEAVEYFKKFLELRPEGDDAETARQLIQAFSQ